MSKSDPIPHKDALFDNFQNGVIAALIANTVTWTVPAGVITNLTGKQTTWTTAYNKVKTPGTFTSQDVQDKNLAKKDLTKDLRKAIQQWIMDNDLVTDGQRVAIGLKPKDSTRTRVPVPELTPILEIKSTTGNTLLVHFRYNTEDDAPSKKGKPPGVDRCNLAYKVGGTAPANVKGCNQFKSGKRTPITLNFSQDEGGEKVYIYAQWENNRSETGPWTGSPFVTVIPVQ